MLINLFKDLKNYIWISHYSHSGDTEKKKLRTGREESHILKCVFYWGAGGSHGYNIAAYGGRFNGMINGSKFFQDKSVYIYFLLYHSPDTENVATAASEIFYLRNSEKIPLYPAWQALFDMKNRSQKCFCRWYLYIFLSVRICLLSMLWTLNLTSAALIWQAGLGDHQTQRTG